MAGWFAGETTKVTRHIVVGKRRLSSGESDDYHARIWLGRTKKYKYVNLETRSLSVAKQNALQNHARFEMREEEGLSNFKTFLTSKLSDFEEDYKKREVSDHRKTLVRNQVARFKEYFGKRQTSSIAITELVEYIEWRKVNNRRGKDKGISHGVMNSEATFLASFIGYLANHGIIRESLYRTISSSGWQNRIGKKEQRGAITVAQFKELRKYLETWHLETKLDDRAIYTRQVVHWMVRIAGRTGLRTIELKNLRFCDIVKHDVGCVISVEGKSYAKRKRFRKILSDVNTYRFFQNIKKLVEEAGLGVSENDIVFVKHNGRSAYDLWAQNIRHAFKKLGITEDRDKQSISLYSLRHYWANRQIDAGVSIYDLARYMGTSISMIENYYGKSDTEEIGMRVMGPLIREKLALVDVGVLVAEEVDD
jgi:integrase